MKEFICLSIISYCFAESLVLLKDEGEEEGLKLFQADWQDALLQGLSRYDLRNPGREVNLKLAILFIAD